MKVKGATDDAIANTTVREEGIVALAAPPTAGLGPIVTWVMPGVALVIGFFIYSSYVRRHRQAPEALTVQDTATLERFRTQIDRELDEAPETSRDGARTPK